MTREEIRSLIGGYATGTLTEAERKVLFEAALEDQDLFDELAREQELKEILDQPGAKQRLIAALEPRPATSWWRKPWPWAAAATAAAVVLAVVYLQPPARKEIALVQPSEVRAPEIAPAPPASPAPAPAKQQAQNAAPQNAPRKTELFDQPLARDDRQVAAGGGGRAVAPSAETESAAKTKPAAEPLEKDRLVAAERVEVTAQAPELVQKEATKNFGGAVRSAGALTAPPPPAAFDYRITPERRVQVIPRTDGFLSASAGQVLFLNRAVKANSVNDIDPPADAASVTVILSPRETDAAALNASADLDASTARRLVIPLPAR
jgi:hypothetical protein